MIRTKVVSKRIRNTKIYGFCIVLCAFFSINLQAQVKATIDSTSIKIGEQITYKINVEADSTDMVIFPEGQSFSPLEMIESYAIDTIRKKNKFNLIKNYGLTQFDSGRYTIPSQKVLISDKIFATDSIQVTVRTIEVDTTKQGLYDIKPLLKVEKASNNRWIYILLIIAILAVVAGLIYWFVWRRKPLTEEERVALLPPYDRAKLALKQLDERTYLENSQIKEYYSDLTMALRRYLDEKVYDHALESTTEQLIFRLNLLREGNKISLNKQTLSNIESILKRADLVKFAKVAPDVELAKMDRSTIDLEIDHVKESLPEPTEEEKLMNEQYRLAQIKKDKQRKIVVSSLIVVAALLLTFVGFGLKYGFGYVADKLTGNNSLQLLEGEWVKSAYGVPPVFISTPEVLERVESKTTDSSEIASQVIFGYGNITSPIDIAVSTTKVSDKDTTAVDLEKVAEFKLRFLEKNGVKNIIAKNEKFTTPNAQEGLKVFGTADFPTINEGVTEPGEYAILSFNAANVVQEVLLIWKDNDRYADEIMQRIINSIELKKPE
ncbi:hypothetical protein SAMN03097699_2470 [Flavobacteriaceae bacterium MAR_2010_188]|nr:hypothetical protein SAMN03097699_2470 [Flavobacteriaceae bacterium MAR_2010_188]